MKNARKTVSVVAAMVFGTVAITRAETPRSPFMPANGAAAATPGSAEATPLEFRGILEVDGTLLYGIYDPGKQKSAWVRLNETGRDFVVHSFDSTGNTVSVEFQGRQMSLALKAPKIDTLAMAPSVPNYNPNVPRPGGTPLNTPPALNPNSADEAKRLADVAAEVRRRRQLRMAADQARSGPQQTNPPPGSTGPVPSQLR